jgi:hypothetical protein
MKVVGTLSQRAPVKQRSHQGTWAWSGTTYLQTAPKVGAGGVFLLPDTESGGSAYGDKGGDLAVGASLLPGGRTRTSVLPASSVGAEPTGHGGLSASEGRGDRGGKLCKLRGAEAAYGDQPRRSRSAAIPGRAGQRLAQDVPAQEEGWLKRDNLVRRSGYCG